MNELAPYKVGKIDPDSVGTGEIFNDYAGNKAGSYAHAEGRATTASGNYSHAEGRNAIASGNAAHAEGFLTRASGNYAHAEGSNTIASGNYAHAEGKYNYDDSSAIHMVGIGISSSGRKNAMVIHDDGSIYINGIGGYSGTTTSGAQSLQEVIASLLSQ